MAPASKSTSSTSGKASNPTGPGTDDTADRAPAGAGGGKGASGEAGAGGSGGDRYHHGDLRRALLDAVEDLVRHGGPGSVTLRAAARRAGVSHAAPAHHFGDLSGLLTAFAREGFQRMDAIMARLQGAAPPDAKSQLLATGQGYIRFALAHPGAFQIMFGPGHVDRQDPEFCAAADLPYLRLLNGLASAAGLPQGAVPMLDDRAILAWSAVHGFAALAADGRLPADRVEALMDGMLRRLGRGLVD